MDFIKKKYLCGVIIPVEDKPNNEDLSKNKDEYFDDERENSSFFRSLAGLVTFSTIIPLGVYTSIESVVSLTWLWPLLNAFIGLLGVMIAYFLLYYIHFSSPLIAIIVYAFFLIIMGYNHLDGLLDFADGVMVHGGYDKKISVMRDPIVGTGGIATFAIVSLMTVAALISIINYQALWAILIGEMSAKIALCTVCVSSKPSNSGIGKYFVENMPIPNYVASLLIGFIIGYYLLGYVGVFGVIGGMFGGVVVSLIAKRNFGVATGDVLGASNEIGRLFSLLFLVIGLSLF